MLNISHSPDRGPSMTEPARPARGRVGIIATATALVSLLLVAATWGVTAAQEPEEPELTWAPLVTLPPIAEPPIATPIELADGFTLGSAGAPVAIEVWEDFQCTFCQRFAFQIKPSIVEEYVETGKATLTFRNLAFLGDESHWAAVASSLAADQNKFWPFHDYLFANLLGANMGSYSLERLLSIGEAAELDMDQFRAGLVLDNARERFAEIDAASRQDAAALGISATPTVTVNGIPLQAPDFATIAAAVDVALAESGEVTDDTVDEATDEPAADAEATPEGE
jgi:protein-disulfide isomerase